MKSSKIKTPEILLPALRQYQHNDYSGLLAGFDYDEIIKIMNTVAENAHMAGQADAGVDPGYSNARAYCSNLFNK